jgi:hypothetical protein
MLALDTIPSLKLMKAAATGDVSAVRLLLSNGADINYQNNDSKVNREILREKERGRS